LRYICTTGEVLDVALIKKLHIALLNTSIIPMYGLTECKRVSIMPPGRWDKIWAGSCGLPLADTKVELIDGELVVYGPNIMNGYWGDESTTQKTFCTDAAGTRYLKTGDLFSIDADGFLYYKGRIKNLIKVGGNAVSSTEIEDFIRGIDGVLDVSVFGIRDETYGEIVCGFIYSFMDNIRSVVEQAQNGLPWYKHMNKISITDKPLPLNKNGKIDVERLRCEMEML
jgi:acyl-CoA synthetase (AMP-forming)/AMP-acid ligase II